MKNRAVTSKDNIEKDKQVMAQCVNGDLRAKEAFVIRFSSLVYHAIQHTLRTRNVYFTREDLQDLHSSVFLQLFNNNCKKLDQYTGKNDCSPATWINIITTRHVIDQLRKRGFDSLSSQASKISIDNLISINEHQNEHLNERGPDADPQEEQAEKHQRIANAIHHLSPRERLLVKLYFDKGIPVAQIAETMKISVENTYTLKHRTIKKLKNIVQAK